MSNYDSYHSGYPQQHGQSSGWGGVKEGATNAFEKQLKQREAEAQGYQGQSSQNYPQQNYSQQNSQQGYLPQDYSQQGYPPQDYYTAPGPSVPSYTPYGQGPSQLVPQYASPPPVTEPSHQGWRWAIDPRNITWNARNVESGSDDDRRQPILYYESLSQDKEVPIEGNLVFNEYSKKGDLKAHIHYNSGNLQIVQFYEIQAYDNMPHSTPVCERLYVRDHRGNGWKFSEPPGPNYSAKLPVRHHDSSHIHHNCPGTQSASSGGYGQPPSNLYANPSGPQQQFPSQQSSWSAPATNLYTAPPAAQLGTQANNSMYGQTQALAPLASANQGPYPPSNPTQHGYSQPGYASYGQVQQSPFYGTQAGQSDPQASPDHRPFGYSRNFRLPMVPPKYIENAGYAVPDLRQMNVHTPPSGSEARHAIVQEISLPDAPYEGPRYLKYSHRYLGTDGKSHTTQDIIIEWYHAHNDRLRKFEWIGYTHPPPDTGIGQSSHSISSRVMGHVGRLGQNIGGAVVNSPFAQKMANKLPGNLHNSR